MTHYPEVAGDHLFSFAFHRQKHWVIPAVTVGLLLVAALLTLLPGEIKPAIDFKDQATAAIPANSKP